MRGRDDARRQARIAEVFLDEGVDGCQQGVFPRWRRDGTVLPDPGREHHGEQVEHRGPELGRAGGIVVAEAAGKLADQGRDQGGRAAVTEDAEARPALQETIEFLGLIDIQDTVIGRKARNTGHKAIRARAVTDLANYIGWEKSHGVYYMGVPDMAVGPLYYSLYDAACVRIGAMRCKQRRQGSLDHDCSRKFRAISCPRGVSTDSG